ncbi:MAG TPA: LD-carboxypeptidase [Candidatus Eremiobacteraceae bacterium]|nr:LD-carboxypeptidase [Candidatus Eremiobacteraceae bacterium]
MSASTLRAGHSEHFAAVKAPAVAKGARVGIFAPSSPAEEERVQRGLKEIRALGYVPDDNFSRDSQAYFSASVEDRLRDFKTQLSDPEIEALIALRGGYGSNYMLETLWSQRSLQPKCIIGYSDITSLQILLWQKFHTVAFHGPMVAVGFDAGAGAPNGYDRESLEAAISGLSTTWRVNLGGEAILRGEAEGIVLGGCMTPVETTLGTPWELDTTDCILVLEDRGMKPWQIDRALMHLAQAGKFKNVKGVILGEFPECDPSVKGSPTAKEVCERILKPLGVPIVYGAAVGHTPRPILTIPFGIRVRLIAEATGTLEFLESAVIP